MTLEISLLVSSSATMISDRVSGSIWMRASPSCVALRYVRVLEAVPVFALEVPPAPVRCWVLPVLPVAPVLRWPVVLFVWADRRATEIRLNAQATRANRLNGEIFMNKARNL